MAPTRSNAQEIANLTAQAGSSMLTALTHLTEAVERAENDYPHNGDRLQSALGALRLAAAVVGSESSTWRDYARNRDD